MIEDRMDKRIFMGRLHAAVPPLCEPQVRPSDPTSTAQAGAFSQAYVEQS
jgi:hypothetical protein